MTLVCIISDFRGEGTGETGQTWGKQTEELSRPGCETGMGGRDWGIGLGQGQEKDAELSPICPRPTQISARQQPTQSINHQSYIGEFFQGGFLGMKVVTFFATLRADLEDFFKCRR